MEIPARDISLSTKDQLSRLRTALLQADIFLWLDLPSSTSKWPASSRRAWP